MRELVTTLLDVLGLLLVAAGATFGAALVIGLGPALAVAGVILLAVSWWWARPPRRKKGEAA